MTVHSYHIIIIHVYYVWKYVFTVYIMFLFRWILDNFSFLIPHMIEVPRRNTVSLKAKAAAAAPLVAASTSTSVEVIPDPHDDCILDVPEMPDIPPSQPTSESFALRRPSHTETTTTVRRGKKRPAPAADDSTSTDKRAIDEMQSQREQSNELAQLSRDLLQTLRPTTSLDKHHMCGYLSSQFNELRPEIWKRYRTRFFLLCEEMVAENDAANAAQRQGQQQQQQQQQQQPQQQQPLHQQPQQQQQHVHNEWQPPPSQRTFPAQTVTRSSARSSSCPPFKTPTYATLNTPQLPSQGSLDRMSFKASLGSLLNQNRDSQGSVVDQVLDDQQPDQQSDASSDQPPSDDQ